MKRTTAPKSRTGCRTCKKRHIRCDEGKPSCTQCTTSGRRCEGYLTWNNDDAWIAYEPPKRAAFQLATKPKAQVYGLGLPPQPLIHIPLDSTDDVAYFFRHSLPVFSGVFNETFWNRTLLQCTVTVPEVRYAVTAVGSIHRHVISPSRVSPAFQTKETTSDTPYRLYHQALRGLASLTTKNDHGSETKGLAVICVILFVVFEAMCGDYGAGLRHLNAAIKGMQLDDPKVADTIDPAILSYIRRLDVLASTYSGMRSPMMKSIRSSPQRKPSTDSNWTSQTESSFPSKCSAELMPLTQARDQLDSIILEIYTMVRTHSALMRPLSSFDDIEIGDDVRTKSYAPSKLAIHELQSALQDWHDNIFQPARRLAGGPEFSALQVMYESFNVMLASCTYTAEVMFDRHLSSFATIIEHAEVLADRSRPAAFGLDAGAVQPVYMVALKCREPRIRARALNILTSINVRDGVWDGRIMCHVAQQVTALELRMANAWHRQFGSSREVQAMWHGIPECARIHGISTTISRAKERNAMQITYRYKPEGSDGAWKDLREELSLEWRYAPQDSYGDFETLGSLMTDDDQPGADARRWRPLGREWMTCTCSASTSDNTKIVSPMLDDRPLRLNPGAAAARPFPMSIAEMAEEPVLELRPKAEWQTADKHWIYIRETEESSFLPIG